MNETMKKYAALFCREDSAYKNRPQWDVYDKKRDARNYLGKLPVVCHPPCRSWSQLQHRSFRSKDNPGYHRAIEMKLAFDSLAAIYSVGGILEHPKGSRIWNTGNMELGHILTIDQWDFGHIAHKPTKLFIYPKIKLPDLPIPADFFNHNKPAYSVTGETPGTLDAKSWRPKNYGREYTPEKLIDWFEIILDRIITKMQLSRNQE